MNNHSDNFSPTSDSVSGDVNTYIQGQDVHDYQYQYQHQSPLNYQYDGQYPLPTHPTSSEYVSASTPEVVHHYQGVPDTLENQQHTLAQHRRSRPGEHQHAMAQRRPMSQTPFFEVIIPTSIFVLVYRYITVYTNDRFLFLSDAQWYCQPWPPQPNLFLNSTSRPETLKRVLH